MRIYSALFLLTVSGFAPLTWAHDVIGSLTASASATDYYKVTCYDDGSGATEHLEVKIKDLAPVAPPLVSVLVSKQIGKNFIVKNTTDGSDGNATYSPAINITGGNGDYFLGVNKSAQPAENYQLQLHCLTHEGFHTGIHDPLLIQNQ
ncbi:MAG: hypothetical protein LAC70_04665 [Methylovulum sp.]|jgi:hypothetical protein|nr:hypothetical protein [Methylovulum sp.]